MLSGSCTQCSLNHFLNHFNSIHLLSCLFVWEHILYFDYIHLLLLTSQALSTKNCLLKTAPPPLPLPHRYFLVAPPWLKTASHPSPPFHFPSQTPPPFLFVRNGEGRGLGGGWLPQLGYSCWLARAECQEVWLRLDTLHLLLRSTPKHTTIYPYCEQARGGGGGQMAMKQRQKEKNSQTDRCKEEIARWCLKYKTIC